MHTLSVDQFTPDSLGELFEDADRMRSRVEGRSWLRRRLARRHLGIGLTTLFYEPSSRTSTSFLEGAGKMGMYLIQINEAGTYSSAAKGETLEDTIKTHNEYKKPTGIIVLRHPETGAAARAAIVSEKPIINGGDGAGEHPTQALLDAYTIQRAKGRLDNLRVVIGGDLLRGRTARSLAKLLSLYRNNSLLFVSKPGLAMADDIKLHLLNSGTEFEEAFEMNGVFKEADIAYWTREQLERPLDKKSEMDVAVEEVLESAIPRVDKDVPALGFVIDEAIADSMPPQTRIMHPLPRVGEISPAVDKDPRAIYFPQVGNGMYARMALIDKLLSNS